MSQLLLWDMLRGPDSTGLAVVSKYNSQQPAEIFKRPFSAYDFLLMRPVTQLLQRAGGVGAMIGHNRSATRGSVGQEETHPFQQGHITLVHNGTLVGQSYKQLATIAPAEVDSAYIAAGMAQHGEKETLENLNGSFALVWHNSKNGTINIARNDGRPFVWIYDNHDTMWFASEWEMLYAVLSRNGRKFTSKFIMPAPMKWYSFPIDATREYTSVPFVESKPRQVIPQTYTTVGNGGGVASTTNISSAREKKAALKLGKYKLRPDQLISAKAVSWTPYKKHRKRQVGILRLTSALVTGAALLIHNVTKAEFQHMVDTRATVYVRARTVLTSSGKDEIVAELEATSPRESAEQSVTVRGPGGIRISEAKFKEYTAKGCGQCGGDVSIAEAEHLEWFGEPPSPICVICQEDTNNYFTKGAIH